MQWQRFPSRQQSHGSAGCADPTDVLTFHNDNSRTGQNLKESILTPANVKSTTFGKLQFFSVDGKVDAQPLYLSNVTVAGALHNLLYVATEHNGLYAFDADTGAIVWHISLLGPGESPSDDHGCDQVTPEIGITATGVIDRTRGPNGAIYVIAVSKNGSGQYFQRLHALDITTGTELFGGPKRYTHLSPELVPIAPAVWLSLIPHSIQREPLCSFSRE